MRLDTLLPRLGLGLIVAAALAAAAVGVQRTVRWAMWSQVMPRPLGQGPTADLTACEPVGWWTALKVLSQDLDVPCGDGWLVATLGDEVRGALRAERLWDWAAGVDQPVRLRLRSALGLVAAGRGSPVEPTWLAVEASVSGDVETDWIPDSIAAGTDWAAQMGPRWLLMGELRRRVSELDPCSGQLLEAVSLVPDPELTRQATDGAAAALGIPTDFPGVVRSRRQRGLPVSDVPASWVRAILRHDCDGPCLALWAELLNSELEQSDQSGACATEVDPELERLADWMGYDGPQRRGLAWWLERGADWVSASQDPAARLSTIAIGGATGRADPVAVLWDRTASPMTTAVVVSELGRRTGVPVVVRVDAVGGVWMDVGGVQVHRPSCDGDGPQKPPADSAWSLEALAAAALVERARAAAADGNLLSAVGQLSMARRLDPDGVNEQAEKALDGSGAAWDARAGLRVGAALAAAEQASRVITEGPPLALGRNSAPGPCTPESSPGRTP